MLAYRGIRDGGLRDFDAFCDRARAGVHDAGVDYATQQCKDLLAQGVDGLHFYTLNRSNATVQICKSLDVDHAC